MDFFLTATFCLLGLQYACGNIVDDMCRYRFHLRPLPWYQAQEVCRRTDRTLARLDNIEKLELIADMAASNVSSRVPAANVSEIWIGLRAEMSCQNVNHVWENGEELNVASLNPWIDSEDRSKEGCIAFSPDTKKYTVNECNDIKPYICETNVTVPCFDEVRWQDEPIFSLFHIRDKILTMANCGDVCLENKHCIAFQRIHDDCDILEYTGSTSSAELNEIRSAFTLAFIDLSSYTSLTATFSPPLLTTCPDSITPSSTVDVASTMTISNPLVPEPTTENPPDEGATRQSIDEITTFQVTTKDEFIEGITAYSRVSYMSNDAIESSESTYTMSELADKTSSTATPPLTALKSGLRETPVESSTSCPRGGMTSEMISKKIRQIAEDMEGDGGKKDDTCKRVFSENMAGNGCAGDKTFPRGAELMSSINEIRREIIMSKMRGR